MLKSKYVPSGARNTLGLCEKGRDTPCTMSKGPPGAALTPRTMRELLVHEPNGHLFTISAANRCHTPMSSRMLIPPQLVTPLELRYPWDLLAGSRYSTSQVEEPLHQGSHMQVELTQSPLSEQSEAVEQVPEV